MTGTRKRGILLVNLGSPDSPTVRDLRRYLNEFLMDPRVLDLPYLPRRLVVSLAVLPLRSRRSARAYQSIWRKDGSPLMVHSRRMQELLQSRVDEPVALGMRYGSPSIAEAVEKLTTTGPGVISEILLVPLYPHYAMSTFETVVVEARRVIARRCPQATLTIHPPFYDNVLYIEALTATARTYLESGYDHLLFSYHGLPERHLRASDPTGSHCLTVPGCCEIESPAHATCYRAQVLKTTAAFVHATGIPADKYSVAFQSRLGRDRWLQPETLETIRSLARSGIQNLLVICPSFVSDCLETLEEIGIRGRRAFREAGGSDLRLIPCLNDHPLWIKALETWTSG